MPQTHTTKKYKISNLINQKNNNFDNFGRYNIIEKSFAPKYT